MNRIDELLLGWPASVEEVFHQVFIATGADIGDHRHLAARQRARRKLSAVFLFLSVMRHLLTRSGPGGRSGLDIPFQNRVAFMVRNMRFSTSRLMIVCQRFRPSGRKSTQQPGCPRGRFFSADQPDFFTSASRSLVNRSSSSVCWAILSDTKASVSAPDVAAACSINCRILSRAMPIRASMSASVCVLAIRVSPQLPLSLPHLCR